MRRIVVALVVALFVLAAAGCSGSPEPSPATGGTGAAPAKPPAVTPSEPLVDRSPVESGAPEPFPTMETTALPQAVQQKLDAGRPMLLFFYDAKQESTVAQRTELDAVMREYRGLIDLVTFDVSPGSGSGSVDAETAAQLASALGIRSTPYIVVVNRDGSIIWRWLGFVDREIIGREVLSATE